jgi:hypothetical protein
VHIIGLHMVRNYSRLSMRPEAMHSYTKFSSIDNKIMKVNRLDCICISRGDNG